MADQHSCRVIAHSLERFRRDIQQRYPAASGSDPSGAIEETGVRRPDAEPVPRLMKLPPEIGVFLIVVGTAGILLPGPVGSPFLVAGGLALWPSGFRKIEDWFHRMAPGMYRVGIEQIERYLSDLENRYPGTVREL